MLGLYEGVLVCIYLQVGFIGVIRLVGDSIEDLKGLNLVGDFIGIYYWIRSLTVLSDSRIDKRCTFSVFSTHLSVYRSLLLWSLEIYSILILLRGLKPRLDG